MHNGRSMYDTQYMKKKRSPLSNSTKHTIYTIMGALLTTNIISVAAVVVLQNCGLESNLVVFFGMIAAAAAIATLVLLSIVISAGYAPSAEESDEGEPWKAIICGIVLALAIVMFALARLVMLLQRV